jgi:RNA polymerase sigma factor (sigma-70 family)
MEAATAARAGRRKNLSLRPTSRPRRKNEAFDAAFEGFYREHVAEVYQYALAVLTNSADAEDVTQQTFLNAYRAFQRGEKPRKPHNWLIKIAHNVCRMRWRQSGRRPQEIPLEHVSEPVARDDEKPSLDVLLGELARLPFKQRAAIVMREVEDRSYAEIAEVLETTVPAVEALLFRARTNLRARRESLAGALSIAPIPGSLSSFFGAGSGGAVAAGGAVLGSELVLKVAAVVVAGVAGGFAAKTLDAVATASPSTTRSPVRQDVRQSGAKLVGLGHSMPGAQQRVDGAAFRHPGRRLAAQGALSSAPVNDQPSETSLAAAASPTQGSPVAAAAPSPITGTVDKIGASVPALPVAVPTTPAPPATVSVTTPVVPVTVTLPPVTLPPVTLPSPLG